jgi:molybdopterin molybdotransferase
MERVLSFEAALDEVLFHAASVEVPVRVQVTRLHDGEADARAQGRVLAERLLAPRDQPGFNSATRDGFALRASGVSEEIRLRVVGSVRAGETWSGDIVGKREAVEIMTGAALPQGTDAVLMVEHAEVKDGVLRAASGRSLKAGENVVLRGAEARCGDQLLPVGRVIGAAEIAVIASCGRESVKVFAKPKVAIMATGDELVELGGELEAEQIYNSNSYALAALVEGEGGAAERLAIARDERDELRERIRAGAAADLLVLSGGVSMGRFDLVEEVLREMGAEFFFTGALIQPGRPVVFGRLPRTESQWTHFFGLPGNPVSAQVCFHLFVAPMLRSLAGRTAVVPVFVEARLAEEVAGGAKVTRFLPAEMSSAWDGVTARVVGWQGSGDVAANARGNCYCVLPAGVASFSAGETVRLLLR